MKRMLAAHWRMATYDNPYLADGLKLVIVGLGIFYGSRDRSFITTGPIHLQGSSARRWLEGGRQRLVAKQDFIGPLRNYWGYCWGHSWIRWLYRSSTGLLTAIRSRLREIKVNLAAEKYAAS